MYCHNISWCIGKCPLYSGVLNLFRVSFIRGCMYITNFYKPKQLAQDDTTCLHVYCECIFTLQMSRMVEKLFALFQSMSVCMMKHSETTPTLLSPQAELELAVAALPGLWTFHNCQFIGREINLTMRMYVRSALHINVH